MYLKSLVFLSVFIKVSFGAPAIGDMIDLSHFEGRIFGIPSEEAGRRLLNMSAKDNPEELGPYLEGDLLIPRSLGRNGVVGESSRWPNGEIPFQIRGSFDARAMDLIERALNAYHKNTCIHFVRRRSTDSDYISIENAATGCWSSVGRVGGKQVVNLQSPGCTSKIGTVIHELMHAVGFLHEQNREDRDSYIRINWYNVRSGYENNFEKAKSRTTSALGVDYDYGSVMHYNLNAFSKTTGPGGTTMTPLKQTSATIGQRENFSTLDIQKIQRMYKCGAGMSGGGGDGGMASLANGIFGLIASEEGNIAE